MNNGKLIRSYNRDKTHTSCAVYAQKNRYKFIEHDFHSSKPIRVAYVDRPFPIIDFNESEIEFGLELIGFTDWDGYINANPCLGFAKLQFICRVNIEWHGFCNSISI